MRRIDHRAIAVEAVLTRHGTLVGPLMNDITGHPELTPYRGGWAGNDYPATLTSAQKQRARDMTRRLGDRLADEGYVGFFEVDFLVDTGTGDLYLGELNPRISGISSMTNVTAGAYADMPLFLFHLLEYLDVDYEVDIDEINERWSREASVDVWSQIIIKETGDEVELLTRTPRTGIYRLTEDGTVAFRSWGNDWHGITSESEAFYLRILAPGDYRYQGADLGALVTRGRLQTDDNQLEDRCKRWITGIRAQFAGDAAGPAADRAGQPAILQDGLTPWACRALGADWPQDQPQASGPHPLDPLTADEISDVAAVLRRDRDVEPPRWRFASIELVEPAKAALRGPGPVRREALAVCWNREDGRAYRAVVSLSDGAVTGWEELGDGQQPNMTVDEWHECDEMLRAHPELIAALARRGITDMTLVLADVWAYGAALVPERYRGLRIGWADVWHRGSADGNPYAHHVTGLHPVVDLNRMELLELEDSLEGEPRPTTRPSVMGEYLPKLIPMPLREVKPLEVSQPDGVSFTLEGRLLSLAELGAAAGLQPPRGPGPAHGGVPRRGAAAAGRAPALVRRDVRALPGRHPRPLPADGVRHRRVGPGLHDHLAGARLRLPGRDHLPGRGGARLARRAGDHTERDLHPRGGQRRSAGSTWTTRRARRCGAPGGS